MAIQVLPHLNAGLNAVATILLLIGFILIRNGRKDAHRAVMIAAGCVSGLFLISYVTLRFFAPIFEFQGEGPVRIFYFTLLATHVVLAMAIVPMVLMTVWRAFRGNFDGHRAVARWTWPVWMYVSVSGIAVYVMLYQFYPVQTAGL